jgi:PhnB protein
MERTTTMTTKIKPIPEEFRTVTPVLVIRDAAEALEFYQRAFGAQVRGRLDRPDGKLMHACFKIGDSVIMIGEECPSHEGHAENCARSPADLRGTTVNLYLYFPDADKAFQQALRAGGKQVTPVEETFWGDRMGMIRDPYGHLWSIATRVRNLTPEEVKNRAHEEMTQKV